MTGSAVSAAVGRGPLLLVPEVSDRHAKLGKLLRGCGFAHATAVPRHPQDRHRAAGAVDGDLLDPPCTVCSGMRRVLSPCAPTGAANCQNYRPSPAVPVCCQPEPAISAHQPRSVCRRPACTSGPGRCPPPDRATTCGRAPRRGRPTTPPARPAGPGDLHGDDLAHRSSLPRILKRPGSRDV